MNVTIFRRTECYTWWLPFLGMVATVSFQAFHIVGEPPAYTATGKLLVAMPVIRAPWDRTPWTDDEKAKFYATQIELLQGSAVRSNAMQLVRARHPELKECPVEIRVTQTKDSSILDVAGTGPEPKFTRYFLESLLDEYRFFSNRMFANEVMAKTSQPFKGCGEWVAIQETPRQAAEIQTHVWRRLIIAALVGYVAGLVAMLAICLIAGIRAPAQV
jgi:hypothetical protein